MVIVQRRRGLLGFRVLLARGRLLTNGDTVAARYEETMARLEPIIRAGYQVKVQWECEFDDAGIETPELLAHPRLCQGALCTWDDLYWGRTEAMRLHNKARNGETIQYVD